MTGNGTKEGMVSGVLLKEDHLDLYKEGDVISPWPAGSLGHSDYQGC